MPETNNGVVVVSGCFDPLHVGHLSYFREALTLGSRLVVVVDHDGYVSTKHRTLMPQAERAEILRELRIVNEVICNSVPDSIAEVLRTVQPSIFAVGPDHQNLQEIAEYDVCRELGIQIVCVRHSREWHHSSRILERQHAL